MIYYINKKIRIKKEPYNFIPELLTKTKDKEGNEIIAWKKLGYCSTIDGAINLIIRSVPENVLENKGIEKTILENYIKILENLSKNIFVEIKKEIDIKEKEIE